MNLPNGVQGKFVFLDTNLLINLERISNTSSFDVFFKILKENVLKPLINDAINFEFLRSSNTSKEKQKREEFLKLLLGDNRPMPLTPTTLKEAMDLGNVYSNKNGQYNKQISFVDCLLAADIKKYQTTSILATTDLNDFPLEIFDRSHVYSMDLGKEILTCGFYEFNQSKFDSAYTDFNNN